eukprot:TRINITY_DN8185_c0_g1_i2.p2 TRINITY_DN8185_c0_g1~~TRINITY_DN8185_c0_g1_i2.p2  ORF type:complete len:370 (+),score=66.77 TRINITY_DN8185_c0_g1_i2:110-1219(+)
MQLSEFEDMDYFDYATTSLVSYCSLQELKSIISTLFKVIVEHSTLYCYMESKAANKYSRLLLKFAKHPPVLSAWFQSPAFVSDLELIFFVHLPATRHLLSYFPELYYPNLSFPGEHKEKFYSDMETLCSICNANEETFFALTKLLMSETSLQTINGGTLTPRFVLFNFLDYQIKKNMKCAQDFLDNHSECTDSSTIANVCFSLLYYLELDVFTSAKNYPFSMLHRSDESSEFVKLDRMGGTLSHLLSVYKKDLKASFKLIFNPPTAVTVFHFSLFNKIIILLNCSVLNDLDMVQQAFECYTPLNRLYEELLGPYNDSPNSVSDRLKEVITDHLYYQHYLFTYANIKVFDHFSTRCCTSWRTTYWICAIT